MCAERDTVSCRCAQLGLLARAWHSRMKTAACDELEGSLMRLPFASSVTLWVGAGPADESRRCTPCPEDCERRFRHRAPPRLVRQLSVQGRGPCDSSPSART